ncbi:VOC family protein [Nocardia suismassiliense]|uniref:VOC family protein n=1 Tax=Nocardia suismassiliense TaxID=2077092 RepID=A0ABW6R2I1_9NOCA
MGFMSPGQVVWFEIGTRDATAVEKFYTELFGWSFELDPDSSIDGRRYIRILAPSAPWPMGAIHENPSGVEQLNLSLLSADVAADTERLSDLGAEVLVPPTRVAEVTSFAVLADPLGNPFSLFARTESANLKDRADATEDYMTQSSYAPTPGSMAWFELGTTDAETTRDFYTRAFGWRFEIDESAGGKPYYNIFTGMEYPSGGLYDHGADGPDYFMPSFLTDDVRARTETAEQLGAAVEHGPDSNPDGLVYARIVDPAGNRFGLFTAPTHA